MKILKIALITIVCVLAIGLVGLFIFIKTFDVNRYLPQLTDSASKALGRPVKIQNGDVRLSWQGVSVGISGVSVADEAEFSQKPLLELSKADLALAFMPLVLHRQVHISTITVKEAKVNIVRLPDGRVNISALGSKPAAPPPPAQAAPPPASTATAPAAAQESASDSPLPDIYARDILIKDASVEFTDQNTQMPMHVLVAHLNVKGKHFSLTDPFPFELDAVVLSREHNVHAQGTVALDLKQGRVAFTNLNVVSDLANLDIAELAAASPALAKANLPEQWKGKLSAKIATLALGAAGLEDLKARVDVLDGMVKLKELASPLTGVRLSASADKNTIELQQITAHLKEGAIEMKGEVKDYVKSQVFSLQTSVQGIQVEDVLDPKNLPYRVKGMIKGNALLTGQGFGPDVLAKNLKGQGEFFADGTVIEGLNILKTVLGSVLGFIPGLAAQVEDMLSEKVKAKLDSDTTVLEKVHGKFSIEDALVFIDEGVVQSPVFELSAKGSLGFDMMTDMVLAVRLDPEVSTELLNGVEQMSVLSDESKRIKISGKLIGTLPQVKFVPDVQLKDVTKNVLIEEGSKQLQKVIEKNPEVGNILNSIFGAPNSSGPDTSSQTQQNAATEGQTSGEDASNDASKKAIGAILDSIFK